jgi:GNAT superfamily N-acetyltransferase
MEVQIKELSPELWHDFEKLFGSNGACGGCWCMSWRIEKHEKWKDIKGDIAKKRMQEMIATGKARGLLAYVGDEPVGWCSFDRRTEYSRLDRAPSLKCDDAEQVWSIPCFFIKRGYRGKSIGTMLMQQALKSIAGHGGKVAEGYPASPLKNGERTPDAFAWTGTLRMFEKNGFAKADAKSTGKIRMRRSLTD